MNDYSNLSKSEKLKYAADSLNLMPDGDALALALTSLCDDDYEVERALAENPCIPFLGNGASIADLLASGEDCMTVMNLAGNPNLDKFTNAESLASGLAHNAECHVRWELAENPSLALLPNASELVALLLADDESDVVAAINSNEAVRQHIVKK